MEVIMLSLWNPFVPVTSKSDSKMSHKTYFDRLFEDTFHSAFSDLIHIPASMGIDSKNNEDGSLSVSIDVPGISESDLQIELSEGIITVKGERKTASSSYNLTKSFSVPEGYDAENIIAELKDGVLNLKMSAKQLPTKEVKKIPLLTNK
jgi:Molecular chaperone (small heat shock protein)